MKHISRLSKKKEEIVVLEDKVLARKDIMRKRMVSVQNSSNTSLVVEVVVESKKLCRFLTTYERSFYYFRS